MVARKIDRDTLVDLYTLYHDVNNDFTLKYLANKVGISRSRLGKLFKRINPETLCVDYDDDEKYLPALNNYLSGENTVANLAQQWRISRSTLYRKFEKLINGK